MGKYPLYFLISGIGLAVLSNITFLDTSKLEELKVNRNNRMVLAETIVKLVEPKKEETIEDMIKRIWKVDGETLKVVIATAKHENGYQLRNGWDCKIVTGNTNGSEDVGIFMINSLHHKRFGGKEALKDCETNIKAGYQIYLDRQKVSGKGLSAWYSYVYGKYKMFM